MAAKKPLDKEVVSDKITVNKKLKTANGVSKGIPEEITFRVCRDEDGIFCASTEDDKIYTCGKTLNNLWDNIVDIVELYYDVPHTAFTICLKFEAKENDSAKTVTCESLKG
jgi:hypothetical protein